MSHDSAHRAFDLSSSKEATAQQDSASSFRCNHCVLIFRTRFYLYEHLHQVHGLGVEAALRDSGLKSLPQIKPKPENRLKAIKSDFAFNCKHCSFKSVNWSIFNEHKKQCSSTPKNDNPRPKASVLFKEQKSPTGSQETNYAKGPHKSASKDVKIYSKSPQTITKYFPAAATMKSDYQSKEKKAKTLRLEGSSLTSCGVFQVTATSIDIGHASKNTSHLLSDLISDPTSAKPVDPFKEATLTNALKRTSKVNECIPSKRAKIEMDQQNHTQTSNCAELSFEFSDDEEEKDLVDKKAETIKCKHCDFQSASMEHVYSHYEENHAYLRYNSFYIEDKSDQFATFRCLECPVEFSSDVHLRSHYSKDHPDTPDIFSLKSAQLNLIYKCFVCPFTSSILQSLRDHHKEKHPSHNVENPLLYCKYTSPQHSICVSEKGVSEAHKSLETLHPEKTTTPCQDQRSPTISPKLQIKAQDGALYNCVKCSFSHKSVVVLHVHYKKCHPEEPISLDKIKQSVGTPSVTASAEHPAKDVDLSHSFVKKENWASPLSDPENISESISVNCDLQPALLTAGLDNPSLSLVNEKIFFCDCCNFSSSNIKSVISHNNAKHGIKTTIEDVLRHTSMMESKNVESNSMAGVCPSPRDLYYCQVCNVGNSSVVGLINHQNKVHDICRSKERILEYTAIIHDQIEKSKSHPNNSILPCGLPLPLIKGKSALYFCYVCNFRNKDIAVINRHIFRVHKGCQINSQQIIEHTSMIYERLNASLQIKSPEQSQEVILAHAEKKEAKPRKSRSLGESLQVRLKCSQCSYEAHHLYLMRKHIINWHKTKMSFSDIVQICGTGPHFEPGYYCDICTFRVGNVAEVKSHGIERHGRSLSIQSLSTQMYLSPDTCYPQKKSNPFENSDTPNGNSPQTYPEAYSCKSCHFKGTSFSSITSHYQTVHVKEGDSKKQNLSSKVQKFNDTQQDFDSYQEPLDFDKLKVPTDKAKDYSCPHCPSTFEGQGGLIIHIGMKHRDKAQKHPQLAKRMQIFKCRSCSYVNNIRNGVLSHTKMKHPTKAMKCGNFFIEREQLHDVEMKVKNGHWKFCGHICKECSQIYPSKEKLKEHYKTHRKQPLLSTVISEHEGSKATHEEIWCQFCGLYCASTKELSSHLRVCQKSSSIYPCALCRDAFTTKVQLGLHYTKKHGEKAFFKHYAPLYNQPSNETVPQKNNNLHGQVSTVQLRMFKCPSCRYVNSSFHGTLTHSQMRHPKIVVRADRLKTVEIDTANMIGYLPDCKTYGGFRCKKCPLIYRELKKLKNHCETAHDFRARASSQLPAHTQQPPVVQTKESESASSSQTKVVAKFRHFFKCSLCSFSTSILKTLGRHYRNKHGKTAYIKFYSPLFHQAIKKPNSSVTYEQTRKTDQFEKSENVQQKVIPQLRVYKCSICSYGTPYRRYLVAHFKNRHKLETKAINKQMEKFKNWESTLPIGRFPCKKCPNMSFVSKGRLLAHYGTVHSSEVKEFKIVAERTHRTTGVYRCIRCKQKIFGIKNLCKHLDQHRARRMKKQKEIESKIVEVSEENPPSLYPVDDELESEVRSEETVKSPSVTFDTEVPKQPCEGKHTCLRCKRTFMSLKGLRSHERSHAAFAALDNFTSTDSLEQLDQYIVYRGGTTRPYMCKLCPYRSSVMGLCKCHFLKKHRNVSRFTEADKHFEEETQQVREVAPNVMNELNVDGDEGPENSFLEPPDVQRQLKHYNVMAQINPASKTQDIQLSDPRMLPCEMCNFNSQHYSNMRRHYLRRHGKKLIRCKDCSFFTCFKQNLDLHEQMGHSCVQSEPTHLKNLCCPFCLYQSKNKNNMIDHIVLHREERMMPIEVRRSKLSRYLQGIIFRCYKCTFTSGSADSLESHMGKHNDIKPFKCRLCYFDCTQLRDLEAHLCDKHQVVRNHQLVGQVSLDQLEEREDCNTQDDDDYNDYDAVLHNPQNDEAVDSEQPNKEMAKDDDPIKEKVNNEVLKDEVCQDTPNTQSTNGQSCDETVKAQTDVNELQLDENTHDQAQTKTREKINDSSVGCKVDGHCKVQDNTQSVMTDVDNQKETSVTEHVDDLTVDCAAAVDSLKDSESNLEKPLVDDTADTGKNGLILPISVELQTSHKVQEKQSIGGVDSNPSDKTKGTEESSSYGEMPILEKYFKEQRFIFAQHCENSQNICTWEECMEDGSEVGKMEDQETQNPPILLDCVAAVHPPAAATVFPCDLCGRTLANTSELQRHMMRHGM